MPSTDRPLEYMMSEAPIFMPLLGYMPKARTLVDPVSSVRVSRARTCGRQRQVEEEQAVSGNTRTRNTTKLAFGSSLSASCTPVCMLFFRQMSGDKCSRYTVLPW